MSNPINPQQQLTSPYLHLWDIAGGPAIQIPVIVDPHGYYNLQGVNFDMVNSPSADALLATVVGVNLNTTSEQVLYRVPAGYSVCIISRVVVRNMSASATTASYGFGWNAGTDTNVLASATHTELTGNTLATVLVPIAGQAVGAANGQFSVKATIAQGSALTCTIDVWGFLLA